MTRTYQLGFFLVGLLLIFGEAHAQRFLSVFPESAHDRSYRAGDPAGPNTNDQPRERLAAFWAALRHGPDVQTAARQALRDFGGKLPIHFYGPDPRFPQHMDHIVIWDVYEDLNDIATSQNSGVVRYSILQPQNANPIRNDRFEVDGVSIEKTTP